MAGEISSQAKLTLALEGFERVISSFEQAIQRGDKLDDALKRLQKDFIAVKRDAGDAGDAAAAAGQKAAKGWKAYADALQKANKAHRKSELKSLEGDVKPGDIPKKHVSELSREELEAIEKVSVARRANYERDALARLNSIRKAEAAEIAAAKRVSDAKMRLADREAAAYMKATNDSGRAGISGRALSVGAPRTDAQNAQRAAGVADFDRQFAAAEASIGKVAQVEASLPRLRYALYDVATTAGIVSAAISGIGVASVAAFASMESSFTSVERTLDGITDPAKVAALRSELVGLTREIPQSFANISEIATLGNQLGIQAGDIAKFTEVTAKFSAVTGLTAEASAMAFGSLGQLLHVQSRDYEALGSSIALVGRKSVATEAEIVAMTTRLAASATNAGFTAQQVIALSGAFASLRIAPERAQGVMEVYFKRLNTAISEGGPRLEAFAKIAGVTTAQVEQLVRTDPVAFFEKLATSLGQMDSIAQTGALSQLGLDGIRAGEVFGRVSANVDVFNKALTDANQGWSQGTELGDQYAKVVDDLASRWQIFLNALQEAGAAVGAVLAPALGVLLNMLSKMLESFASFANTPFGAFATGAVVAVGALVAGLTGLIAAGALGLASMAALSTAVKEFTIASGASVLSVRTLGAAISSVGVQAGFSAGAIRVFKTALISTGVGAVVVLLGTLIAGLVDATSATQGFSAEARSLGDALNRAIDADTEAFFSKSADAVSTYTREVGTAATETDKSATAAASAAGVQGDLADSTQATTDKITEQIAVLGKHSEALFRQNLAKDPQFEKFANDPALLDAAKQAGFSIDQMIAQGMAEGGSFTAAVDALRVKADEMRVAWQQATIDGGATAQTDAMYQQVEALQAAIDATDGWAAKQDEGRAAADAAASSYSAAGASLTETADAGYAAGDGATAAAGGMYDAQSAAIAAQNELFNLGATLGEGAGMWDQYSEAGRGNLSALYAWMTSVAGQTGATTSGTAANFAAMYNALIQGGVATANQLLFLRDAAASLAGTSFGNIKPAAVDFTNLFNGIQSGAAKAAKAIGGGGGRKGGGGGSVAKAIRTLIDYANDLSGVMKRAFDIRFGNQSGLDEVASGWHKIAEESSKAREEIAKYQASLADIAADTKIKQYWLSVAENYGDELRATKLRAELSDLNADQAKTQKDLSKAQASASKTLAGNSDAAIENRSTILDMVGSYQDLLKTYAANGMSQEDLKRKAAQLKAEFIAQATQAGFSRAEIARYATSFDDMALAINRVPRNVTVSANINPALQALAEFEAKAKKAGQDASNSIRTGGGGGYNIPKPYVPPFIVPIKFQMPSYSQLMAMQQAIRNLTGDKQFRIAVGPGGQGGQVFKTGGYTGGTSTNDIVGAVHGKEYVMSAPAVQTLGVNGMNFLHNMLKSGRIPTMGGGGNGVGLVDLSAGSIQAISNAFASRLQVILPGAQLAGSVGAHNVATTSRGAS